MKNRLEKPLPLEAMEKSKNTNLRVENSEKDIHNSQHPKGYMENNEVSSEPGFHPGSPKVGWFNVVNYQLVKTEQTVDKRPHLFICEHVPFI